MTRLVITLKRDANANVILNNLYKHTPMQVNFPVNTVALVDGVPRTLDLAQLVRSLHRPPDRGRHPPLRVPARARRRTELHIIEGLLRAIDMLDAVIEAIRNSDDRPAANGLFDGGAVLVLGDPGEPHPRHDACQAHPARSQQPRGGARAAADDDRRAGVDPRRPGQAAGGHLPRSSERSCGEVRQSPVGRWSPTIPGELGVEDLIEDEEIVVTMTRAGYIKAVSSDAFRTQGRGGRGVQGARLKEEDLISIAVHTTTLAHLLLFSNKGRVFRLRAHEVPMKERTARGHRGREPASARPGRDDPGAGRDQGLRVRRLPDVRDQVRAR